MATQETTTPSGSSICTLGLCKKRRGRFKPRAGGHSDIGPIRETNDDLVFANQDCKLYVALDGIGGYAGGGEASRIVLERLRKNIESMCQASSHSPVDELKRAVTKALHDAHLDMLKVARQVPAMEQMGTVFALAYIVDDTLLYTHVGDSRVYLIRDGKAQQLTSDETYVQLMVDVGVIQPEEIPKHPMRNVVLNSVGTRTPEDSPVVHKLRLHAGDVVLLTTDGVSDKLRETTLAQLVAQHDDAQVLAVSLVNAALDAGTRDNASCVAVFLDKANDMENTPTDDLHTELTKLHDMLANVESVDEKLREEMQQVAQDIRRALHPEEDSQQLPGLTQQLKDQALTFEVSHPQLTNTVATITNLLSRMGI